ncbi:MAG TPA: hypothetical protein VJX74_07635 [Blastocatellia bacterium]|nr:hypothetical protein [Blastocatellia bacterium]
MKLLLTTLKKFLFWSYERGSWQYDVMCVVILAFIFFAPNSVFHNRSNAADDAMTRPIIVTSEEIGPIEHDKMEQEISAWLSKKQGHIVNISRVERVIDDSGAVKYLVYEQ